MSLAKPNSFRSGPDERGHFGIFGGRFVAETLMPLILVLEKAYADAKADPAFQAEMNGYLKHYVGRPSPLYFAERLTEHLQQPAVGQPRERLWQVRAAAVVIAAGAIERPLVFPGNDRPGILLAGAGQTYLNRYGVRVGSRAVIVTAADGAYQTALDLHAAGVTIAAMLVLLAAAYVERRPVAWTALLPAPIAGPAVCARGALLGPGGVRCRLFG